MKLEIREIKSSTSHMASSDRMNQRGRHAKIEIREIKGSTLHVVSLDRMNQRGHPVKLDIRDQRNQSKRVTCDVIGQNESKGMPCEVRD